MREQAVTSANGDAFTLRGLPKLQPLHRGRPFCWATVAPAGPVGWAAIKSEKAVTLLRRMR